VVELLAFNQRDGSSILPGGTMVTAWLMGLGREAWRAGRRRRAVLLFRWAAWFCWDDRKADEIFDAADLLEQLI
jgi:hypothetical protein